MKRTACGKLIVVVITLGALMGAGTTRADALTDEAAAKGKYSNEHRFVFYAILEGLYEDGVPAEAINLIVPDVHAMADSERPGRTNFVESCPLCTPAFEAFRTYKLRPVFYGQEGTKFSTFGFGVSAERMRGLRGSPSVRRETIRSMIEDYVGRRLETTALDDEERMDMELRLEDMKKDGHSALARIRRGEKGESLKKVYAGWKFCPNCAGIAPDPQDEED